MYAVNTRRAYKIRQYACFRNIKSDGMHAVEHIKSDNMHALAPRRAYSLGTEKLPQIQSLSNEQIFITFFTSSSGSFLLFLSTHWADTCKHLHWRTYSWANPYRSRFTPSCSLDWQQSLEYADPVGPAAYHTCLPAAQHFTRELWQLCCLCTEGHKDWRMTAQEITSSLPESLCLEGDSSRMTVSHRGLWTWEPGHMGFFLAHHSIRLGNVCFPGLHPFPGLLPFFSRNTSWDHLLICLYLNPISRICLAKGSKLSALNFSSLITVESC